MAWTARTALDLLFPPRCLHCRQRGAFLCLPCIQTINRLPDPFCPACESLVEVEDPHCRCRAPRLRWVIAVGAYEGALRGAIHSLKYQGQRAGAADLADLMAPQLGTVLRPHDRIVPIPLHGRREAARGYNQSALLARALARRLGVEAPRETMIRVRDTPRQVGLDREARKRNVKDAFSGDPDLCRDHRVILVDDVCTTGATLHAAAEAALAAGALRVFAVVLARALPGRDR
jgi:ComF family protein